MDRGVLHERMLMSIYKSITKAETLPTRFGPHWEVIGFQGNDPATDLRGAGILALLQVQRIRWTPLKPQPGLRPSNKTIAF